MVTEYSANAECIEVPDLYRSSRYILRFTQNTRCPETGWIKVTEWSRRERIEVPGPAISVSLRPTGTRCPGWRRTLSDRVAIVSKRLVLPSRYILRFTQNTRCPETGGIKDAECSANAECIEVPDHYHSSRSRLRSWGYDGQVRPPALPACHPEQQGHRVVS